MSAIEPGVLKEYLEITVIAAAWPLLRSIVPPTASRAAGLAPSSSERTKKPELKRPGVARLTRRTWCLIRALPAITRTLARLSPLCSGAERSTASARPVFERFGAAAELSDAGDQRDRAAAELGQAVVEVVGGVGEALRPFGSFLPPAWIR